MQEVSLESILIASDHPEELRDWYRTAFDAPADGDAGLVLGAVRLLIFPHSQINGRAAEPARIMLNLHVLDADALAAELKSKGVSFVREVEQEPFGRLGTIEDPDGNYIQIFQPTSEEDKHEDIPSAV